MDNLYPTVPTNRKKSYPLFDRFKQEMSQQDLYDQIADPSRYQQQQQQPTGQMHNMTKPMDVVFDQGNISEQARGINAARMAHNVDLNRNALSPYQQGQLQNKDRELGIREQQYGQTNNLAQQRITETAEMNEWKMKNPGGRIVYQPDGQIIAIGPDNKIAGTFGPSGKMGEERRIGVQQQNAVQLADRRGEIAGALEDKAQYGRTSLQTQRGLASIATEAARAGNRPIGTNRDVAYKYGPGGEIIGASSTSKQVLPPKAPGQGTTVTMYGPNGEGPYPVPTERTDEMQDKYGMTFSPAKKK